MFCSAVIGSPQDFYPRSPRGERLTPSLCRVGSCGFLSTLPARGATDAQNGGLPLKVAFLSTLPARGATFALRLLFLLGHISIHAPREGSDTGNQLGSITQSDFYPRSPRGERRLSVVKPEFGV